MRLALETYRYTDLCRGDRAVVEAIEFADEVWLPFIVLGELRAGFAAPLSPTFLRLPLSQM